MDSANFFLCSLAVAFLTAVVVDRIRWPSKLHDIPPIGPSGPILSYYGAVKFILNARSMVQQGYDLYKDGFFRVPMMDRWLVVLTGPDLVDELRKIPDDKLSFDHAIRDILQVKYTFGLETQTYPYHVTIQGQLKRQLGKIFPAIHHEICQAFDEILSPGELGWVNIPIYSAVMKATCRTSNRAFVGLPICQSPEFAQVQTKFALQVVLRASLVNFFPKLMHPFIGRILTNTPSSLKHCMVLLRPIVEERIRRYNDTHDNEISGLPDDVITWLLQVSRPEDRNLRSICLRILVLNFASLHTTAQTLTLALLNLASHAHYIEPLREEVRGVTEKYGWTKESMAMLVKMESFLRESQRVSGTTLFPIIRKAMEDITFSNGTTIPSGTHLAVASVPMHIDDRHYKNASEFDAFRFVLGEDAREDSLQKSRLSSTSRLYLVFGHGNRACPGRFFVSTMLTAMMAHLVLNYDIKLKDGVRPPDQWFLMNCSPNRTAEIMFRRRS